jgi:hypothetical protein
MTEASAVEGAMLAAAASLLDQARVLDRLSRAITVAALVLLLLVAVVPGSPTAWAFVVPALVVLLGLAETYCAMRVGFDAALFRRLAAHAGEGAPDLAGLDAALVGLGLLPQAKAGRPVPDRIAGARRLLSRQAATLGVQVLAVLAGAALALIR